MDTLISIVVPVYNVEKYLVKCINSLLNQTYKNIEILLIDDGSTDTSGIICDDFAKIDDRIVVIHQENSGVSHARNNGILHAKGDWITFCDSDDWCDLAMCASIAKYISDDVDILVWGFTFYKNGKYFKKEKKTDIPMVYEKDTIRLVQLDLFTQQFDPDFMNDTNVLLGTCWGRLYRKNLILKNEVFFPEKLHSIHEDTFFNFLAFQFSRRILFLHDSFNYYRIIETSVCRRYKTYGGEHVRLAVCTLNRILEEGDYLTDLRFRTAYSVYCLEMLRVFFENLSHKDNPQTTKERIETLKLILADGNIKKGLLDYPVCNKTTLKERVFLFLIKRRMYRLIYEFKKRR